MNYAVLGIFSVLINIENCYSFLTLKLCRKSSLETACTEKHDTAFVIKIQTF